MSKYPADFYKLVSTATNLYDNVVDDEVPGRRTPASTRWLGFAWAKQGIISRVLGVRAGSVFTFGAAVKGEETAPGQVTGGRAARHLSHRDDGPGDTSLWRGGRSGVALAVAGNDERGLPARDRQRGLLGAACQEPEGSAGLRAGHSHPRPERHHAVQAGDAERAGEFRPADPADRRLQHGGSRRRRKLYGFNTDVAGSGRCRWNSDCDWPVRAFSSWAQAGWPARQPSD